MRFNSVFFPAVMIASQVSALYILEQNKTTALQANTCGDPSTAVPLFRAYSPSVVDHFYTTSANEIQNVVNEGTYTLEGTAAKVFPIQEQGTVPLYRFYSQTFTDHFYTLDQSEGLNAGYTPEGITGYVYTGTDCGGIPFYRMYLPAPNADHFYTTQGAEVASAGTNGYQFEGVAAYVIPA